MTRYLSIPVSILALTVFATTPAVNAADQPELTKKQTKRLIKKITRKKINAILPIETKNLATEAVTTPKIGMGAVTESEIADGAVTEAKLANVIVAESNKKDDVVDPPAGTFGTAMSVTVVADSVGIIQIVGSVLVVTVGTEDVFDCELMRTTGSNDDLEDTDRRVWVDASREGFCSTNGTLAIGPGTHQIDLRVRKGQATSLIDDGTLQALFVSGGTLDNTDG